MRHILELAVKPEGRIKLGSLLAEIGSKIRLTDEEVAILESVRDRTPARAACFE
jgi:antitoxin FitA